MTVEVVLGTSTLSYNNEVIKVRKFLCASNNEVRHTIRVRLKDGSDISSEDLMSLMDAGRDYFMIPPEGAPAYEAYKVTGAPLILQTRVCEHCQQRVLFA